MTKTTHTKTNVTINSETDITHCRDGFWLYDKNRGMNLAMRAPSERDALIGALEYYQARLNTVEAERKKTSTALEACYALLGVAPICECECYGED